MPPLDTSVVAEYLLELHNDVVDVFLSDRRIKAAGLKTNCTVQLTKRIYNQSVLGNRWLKYSVIKIRGPNMGAINSCNRLIENVFPKYSYRKRYVHPVPRIRITEFLPDNLDLFFPFQRTGVTGTNCGGMNVQSPFQLTQRRTLNDCPWKLRQTESAGMYYSNQTMNESIVGFYGGMDEIEKKKEKGQIRILKPDSNLPKHFNRIFKGIATEGDRHMIYYHPFMDPNTGRGEFPPDDKLRSLPTHFQSHAGGVFEYSRRNKNLHAESQESKFTTQESGTVSRHTEDSSLQTGSDIKNKKSTSSSSRWISESTTNPSSQEVIKGQTTGLNWNLDRGVE